ncbi:MAG: 4-hydroxy-tetrahydrodipicolinate synthase [Actinomycetia bacterium]|nr:4-hydroxy-tetrahydrodipicolinate synthase [Actinomycetes bacterium]MCP4223411.1 4-hydroxy-tetrahydrodipicolinate synthase [Actinomycetes bacterium]MCP5032791.1 4-hydroxy-tetrahydrodipicolinate synthase [Actinomycetes bacterium]
MAQFGSVLTAMVTPFTDDGDLDLEGAQKLARYLVANGNDGVVVAGTTGESPTISKEEQRDLFIAVRQAIPDASIVAGGGSNDTRNAIANTKMATEAGADGILAVAPYYNRPSQEGLYQHFVASAAATDLPVIVYDVPGRTGRKIETATLLRLAAVDNIVALKDAAADPAETASFLAQLDDDSFDVYSGDDSLTLPLLSIGAVGVVGVATHYVGQLMSDMIAAFQAGRVAEAIALNRAMMPAYGHFAYDDAPSPVPTKAMMNLLGVGVGECRLPMGPTPSDMDLRAKSVLARLGRSEA